MKDELQYDFYKSNYDGTDEVKINTFNMKYDAVMRLKAGEIIHANGKKYWAEEAMNYKK